MLAGSAEIGRGRGLGVGLGGGEGVVLGAQKKSVLVAGCKHNLGVCQRVPDGCGWVQEGTGMLK